jgi:hypothetical protein
MRAPSGNAYLARQQPFSRKARISDICRTFWNEIFIAGYVMRVVFADCRSVFLPIRGEPKLATPATQHLE